MSNSTDGHIDQLVQARWREIGLSQSDLAEVLGATPGRQMEGASGRDRVDLNRLRQVAAALGVSTDGFGGRPGYVARGATGLPDSLQSLLELRLLRVFRELRDPDTKRILIELTEQIVKRQAPRSDEAG
jgi:transcriptional regulator with XRE-family HTH domain